MGVISNELYHYGVKGQKWGVRRYQNPDGSYTPEGLKHYNRKSSSSTTKEAIRKLKAEEKEQKKPIHRLDSLTDEELRKGIERLQKETQYLSLTNQKYRSLDELSKNERSVARKTTDSTLKKMGQITMRVVEPVLIGLGIAAVRELLLKSNASDSVITDVMSRFKKK